MSLGLAFQFLLPEKWKPLSPTTDLLSFVGLVWPDWHILLYRGVQVQLPSLQQLGDDRHGDRFTDAGNTHDCVSSARRAILQVSKTKS